MTGLFEFATMTPLQEQVVEHGVCPKCHTKTLVCKSMDTEAAWDQCTTCNTVYCVPARRLIV